MTGSATPVQVLLVEPQFVLRRTLVAVARDLGVAHLHEAVSIDAALTTLAARRFDGLVLAVGDSPAAAFKLLARLRQGGFASNAGIPVVALLAGAQESLDAELHALGPMATLSRPFKVAALLQLLQQQMSPAHA